MNTCLRYVIDLIHTVGFHKSLRVPSAWSKTTLITGHVGGARVCPLTCKMELQEKLSNFGYYFENDFYCNSQSFRVSPEAPFNWKLLLIGIVSAKGI